MNYKTKRRSMTIVKWHWDYPSDDVLEQEAFLIQQGIRPLSEIHGLTMPQHLAQYHRDPQIIEEGKRRLRHNCRRFPSVIPFIIKTQRWEEHNQQDNITKQLDLWFFGYAHSIWFVRVYHWILTTEMPFPIYHTLLGLLFGYSLDEIHQFVARCQPWSELRTADDRII